MGRTDPAADAHAIPPPGTPPHARGEAWPRLATLLVAATLLARLAVQAYRARLSSDECFHAHLSEWIATHGRLPERLPEFFGGLGYSYPPLLHLLGAAWWSRFGATGLVELNVVLFATLLATLALFPVPGIAGTPRRWAILLCLATSWYARFAVSFWAEMLIGLLALVAVMAWLRHHRTERIRDACVAGVALGLALLAKQTALVLLVVPLVAAVVAWRHGRPRRTLGLALSAVIGLAIAAPMFVRNASLFGSPIYPALAPDVDVALYRLYRLQSGYTAGTYLTECASTLGPWVGAMALFAAIVVWRRRRRDVFVALLVTSLAGFGVGWLSPLHTARHVAPLVTLVALASSVLVHDALASRRKLRSWLEALLVSIAIFTQLAQPEVRRPLDLSPELEQAFRAVARDVPEGGTVLTLWVYETAYYTHRPSTWPLAWGQKIHPVELFGDIGPDRFLALLHRDRIDYILMPLWEVPREFLGSDYDARFVDRVVTLTRQRRMHVVWASHELELVATDPGTTQSSVVGAGSRSQVAGRRELGPPGGRTHGHATDRAALDRPQDPAPSPGSAPAGPAPVERLSSLTYSVPVPRKVVCMEFGATGYSARRTTWSPIAYPGSSSP